MKSKILVVGVCLLLLGLLVGVAGCRSYPKCACLYSGMDGMEVLEGENWDMADPDVGYWGEINTIPRDDANDSSWGIRFPDCPWSLMYDQCANWVYGNTDWDDPEKNDHEYYRLPFSVTAEGGCRMLRFQAYVDDGAIFYIDGPGFGGPTLFHEHSPTDSMNSSQADIFWVAPPNAEPFCLGSGDYTIYIDHWDTGGDIYGLIFIVDCISCECSEGPSISVEKSVSADVGESWWNEVEQNVCQNVVFQITATNTGNMPLTDIVISDPLPDCLDYVIEGTSPQPDSTQDNNLVWSFEGPLQPNDSIEVVFVAHVVCAEDCCNVVSVEANSGDQIVSDVDCAVVIGVCAEETVTLTACSCDGLDSTPESPSPNELLLEWIDVNYATRDGVINPDLQGSRDCDETGTNKYWATTFTELKPLCGCHIIAATLEITLNNDDDAYDNDALLIGFIENSSDTWGYNLPLSSEIAVGATGTITIDLSDVNGSNYLTFMESFGFLDVAVQDDSAVDCAVLTITYGP